MEDQEEKEGNRVETIGQGCSPYMVCCNVNSILHRTSKW